MGFRSGGCWEWGEKKEEKEGWLMRCLLFLHAGEGRSALRKIFSCVDSRWRIFYELKPGLSSKGQMASAKESQYYCGFAKPWGVFGSEIDILRFISLYEKRASNARAGTDNDQVRGRWENGIASAAQATSVVPTHRARAGRVQSWMGHFLLISHPGFSVPIAPP